MQPRIVLQAAEQARQTGAAAEASDVQLAKTHRAFNSIYNVEMPSASAVETLEKDLRGIFGARLQSLVTYGERARASNRHSGHGHDELPVQTMAVVETLTRDDLRACAGRVPAWHHAGLATPLVVAAHEFTRSLDAFPLEFGAIIADHTLVGGSNPFSGLAVDAADLRRAVEVQARGHLLHLREGYLETQGRADALAVLIVESAPALAALVASLARLDGQPSHDRAAAARHGERLLGLPAGAIADIVALVGVKEISSQQAELLFPPYLDASERLVSYVDTWR
jgi:hypothetical protein